MKNLDELKAAIATSEEKVTQIRKTIADSVVSPEDNSDKMRQMMMGLYDEMYSMFRGLRDMVYSVHQYHAGWESEHNTNHVPALKTATQMEKFLKSVGAENDYQVFKPMVSIASTKHGKMIELEVKKD